MRSATSQELAGFFVLILFLVALGLVASPRAPASSAAESRQTEWAKAGLPNHMLDPQAGALHVRILAERTGGKWERLSGIEQRWLDGLTVGHGPQMLMRVAEQLRQEERARQKKPARNKRGKEAPH